MAVLLIWSKIFNVANDLGSTQVSTIVNEFSFGLACLLVGAIFFRPVDLHLDLRYVYWNQLKWVVIPILGIFFLNYVGAEPKLFDNSTFYVLSKLSTVFWEEIVFRALLPAIFIAIAQKFQFPTFRKRLCIYIGIVIVTSGLLFGLFHVKTLGWDGFVFASLLGIMFAMVAIRNNLLIVTMLLHLGNNFLTDRVTANFDYTLKLVILSGLALLSIALIAKSKVVLKLLT